MERYDVRKMIEEGLGEFIKWQECPTCKTSTTMVKTDRKVDEEYEEVWRCLTCFGLFRENLQAV